MQLQEMPVPETLNTEAKNNGYDFFFTNRNFINAKTSILQFDFLLLMLCGGSVFVKNRFL